MSEQARRNIETYLARRMSQSAMPSSGLSDVKGLFARLINADPAEIAFVQSTQAGENLFVAGLGFPHTRGNIVTDAFHWDGSLYLYDSLRRKYGIDLRVVAPRDGRIWISDYEKLVDRNTRLIAVSLVSSLNGAMSEMAKLSELAHAHGALLFADVIQAAGAVPIDVRAMGIDGCSCATYKWLMGDFGLGFLYVRKDLQGDRFQRAFYGWPQLKDFQYHMPPYGSPSPQLFSWTARNEDAEGLVEAGTHAYAAQAALHVSLNFFLNAGIGNIRQQPQELVERVKRELPSHGYRLLTPPGTPSPIASFWVEDSARAAARLDKANVTVKLEHSVLRISPSMHNTPSDIDALLNALS